jgi:hypothetical protein
MTQSKAKATVTHPEVFDKFIEATASLRSKPESQQGKIIEAKFLPPLQKRYEETTGDVRKAYKVAYNTFASLRDGLRIGEVAKKHFTETIRDLEKLKKQVIAAEIAASKKDPKPTAEESSIMDSLSDSGQGRNGILEKKGYDVMKKYMKYEGMVPKRLPDKKRFMSIRLPIVAVTDPLLQKERLARFKLCDDTIFGYPFIKNQVLIGINADWIVKDFKRQVNPAIEEMLEALEESSGTKYVSLGVPKLRGQVYWVWVATERDVRYLNQASLGGHFRVTGWDLPFEVKPKS